MKKSLCLLYSFFISLCLFSSCEEKHKEVAWEWPYAPEREKIPVSQKPKILWVDASANFKYTANSKENIVKYINLAKASGFTEIVLDVRPGCGDVLFRSELAQQAKKIGEVERTATWDYLGTFIEEAHRAGLKLNASICAMVGGTNRDGGMLFREPEKKDWATTMYYSSGLISIMDDTNSFTKFFNPVHPDVQQYILDLVAELATQYPELDGIVYDYGRFESLHSDFSDITRKKFEEYIGKSITNFPQDILRWNGNNPVPGEFYKQWLEFRAKVIHDLFDKTRRVIKNINPNLRFGTYTGCWYSSYYELGVNWASKEYDASRYYSWATPDYKNYGYASLLDFYMTGAYGKELYGTDSEWTVQGGILTAQKVTRNEIPVIGGLYGLNYYQQPKNCEEATYLTLTVGDGLMFFDMIYLIMYDQWNDVRKGIDRALATDK
ncbi:alpha amylase family protein [Proteiniphilum sp.]|uniref:alpha amylase family protein n=1 Tax=Proteiniphilum sp. TaxID=1926877 RepID=UPI002B20E0E1|nr:alpha amylase family protein [Proteiniphilum sp.]MEA4916198.1 alpha amylase family protein [Proteiniphilum sp.]